MASVCIRNISYFIGSNTVNLIKLLYLYFCYGMLSKGCTLGCRSLIKKTDVCCLVHYSDTCVAKKKEEEEIFGLRRGNP